MNKKSKKPVRGKRLFLISILSISILCTSSSNDALSYYNLVKVRTRVLTGLENFVLNYSTKYKGKSAILITNHSGVDYKLKQNISLLREKGIFVFMVLAPEHGLFGYQNNFDKRLYIDEKNFNLVVYNLHKLSDKDLGFLLKRTDIILFDIQDMGMRCYTYISNLKTVMDAISGTGKELIVLDRPNPISFLGTDGAYLDRKFKSKYISAFPSPLIYNMTIGESALYYKNVFKQKVKLRVIKMLNYRRGMMYYNTGLPWVPPSPNLPTYESSIVYTAVVLMEGVNLSLGRGTTKPFEYIGAPWIEPYEFAKGLSRLGLKNFKFRPVYFNPTFSVYKGKKCGGVQIFYTGGRFSPTEFSYKVIRYIMKNYRKLKWRRYNTSFHVDYLAGTDSFRTSINSGKDYSDFSNKAAGKVKLYNNKRARYLLY